MRKTSLFGGVLLAAALIAGGPSPRAGVPTSAQEIQPLLIGAAVPEVTLRAPDGSDLDLAAAVKKQPTILVFYRGGW